MSSITTDFRPKAGTTAGCTAICVLNSACFKICQKHVKSKIEFLTKISERSKFQRFNISVNKKSEWNFSTSTRVTRPKRRSLIFFFTSSTKSVSESSCSTKSKSPLRVMRNKVVDSISTLRYRTCK